MSHIMAARAVLGLTTAREEAGGRQASAGNFATVFDSLRQISPSPGESREANVAAGNGWAGETGAAHEAAAHSDAERRTDRFDGQRSSRREERLSEARQSRGADRADTKGGAARSRDELSDAVDTASPESTSEPSTQAGADPDDTEAVHDESPQQHAGGPESEALLPQGLEILVNPALVAACAHPAGGSRGGAGELLSDHAVSVQTQASPPAGAVNTGAVLQFGSGRPGLGMPAGHDAQADAGTDPSQASLRAIDNTEGSAKAAGPSADFQTLLAHVGRGRGTASLKPATGAGSSTAAPEGKLAPNATQAPADLARILRSHVGTRHSSLMLQLDPPELGRMRVDVRMHDDAMTLRFQTETEAGQEAIRGRLQELTGALEQQGVRLDRVEVEHRPPPHPDHSREDQPQWQQGTQQWSEPRPQSEQDPSSAWPDSSEHGPSPEAAGTASDEERLPKRGVDLVV